MQSNIAKHLSEPTYGNNLNTSSIKVKFQDTDIKQTKHNATSNNTKYKA